jgi:hypothetical protein
MTRGNQREIDRQRAANRHAGKGEKNEGDPTKRKENDARALQEKIAAKAAAKAAQEAGGGTTSTTGGATKK